MRDQIRQRFLIDVSLGQCKRAKQRALYNHEGGLIEHYGRLWDYRQALLESNPGSTCRLEVEEVSSGSTYFKRFYICFKGLKDGWLDGCRRIIGLDGCFLKHTCRGELLTTMGRDANNQMYPIAWAVVKGLLDAVGDWLPNAEHRKCTRHVYANFKKKYSGLQLQRLFWGAASSTVEELFYAKMDDLKYINLEAYEYLVARNPNSWCRAFFILNVKCAAFENGISESYHKAILLQRLKPIITMLEDIRIYIMQRLVAMNKLAVNLEDQITPTVRKRLEYLKQEQINWKKQEKEAQDKLDEEALQQSREEEFIFPDQEESMDVEMYNRTKASINFMVNTQESVTHGQPSFVKAASVQPAQFEPAFAEGPSVEPAPSVPASDNATKKKGKRTRSEPDVPFKIYHKNRGRSERIRNMEENKFKFNAQGTSSTPEKAFDVSP
ncbi:hypothetical protein Tco_0736649 [Tanacetum coccineum]